MHVRSFFVALMLIVFLYPGSAPGKNELPGEFGEVVPLFPEAQPVATRYTRDSVSVQFVTDDSYERVFDFYAKLLEDAGWHILPATSSGKLKAEKISFENALIYAEKDGQVSNYVKQKTGGGNMAAQSQNTMTTGKM